VPPCDCGSYHRVPSNTHQRVKSQETGFSSCGNPANPSVREADFSGLGLRSCLLCYDFATGQLGRIEANMQDEEWIKTLGDGRIVKFIYQELLEDGAFISAQLAGNEVVYSVVLTKARNPLSHEDVGNRFKGELSKKYTV
jgi:hypothetical protein